MATRTTDEIASDALDAPVSTIMTRMVFSTMESTPLREFFDLLEARGISGAPVRDIAGRTIGVASKTDLVRAFFANTSAENADADGLTVEDVMTCFPILLPEDASIGRAAALLAYEGVHRVVIVDERGMVAGIVTALDITRWVASRCGPTLSVASGGTSQTTDS